MIFNELREKHKAFYEAVKKWHSESPCPHRGHGLDHDVTVGQISLIIAPDETTGELAWIASLLHSVDRTVEKGAKEDSKDKVVELMSHLSEISFLDWDTILKSVLHHSELNNDKQPLVQQVLMDADRLANLMALVVIRAGQMRYDIPAIEFEYVNWPNPASTYLKPLSIMDCQRSLLSTLGAGHVGYIEQLRLPKAKELGQKYHAQLLSFIKIIQEQHDELGLSGIIL